MILYHHRLYSQLLEYCSTEEETARSQATQYRYFKSKYQNDDVKNIMEYSDLLCHLFNNLENTKNDVEIKRL